MKSLPTFLNVSPDPLPSLPFFCDHSTRRKTQSWTAIDDRRLISAMHKFGTDNWSVVAHFVGNNRTRSQCNPRWSVASTLAFLEVDGCLKKRSGCSHLSPSTASNHGSESAPKSGPEVMCSAVIDITKGVVALAQPIGFGECEIVRSEKKLIDDFVLNKVAIRRLKNLCTFV
jgi:hypothetical protein